MNVFGIGGWELVLVLLIMLIVAGPKRMAQWAYVLGQWTAKARRMWEEIAASLQQELHEAGFDVEVPKTPPTRQSLNRSLADAGKQALRATGMPEDEFANIRGDLEKVGREVKQEVDDMNRAVNDQQPASNGTPPVSAPKTPPAPQQPQQDADDNTPSEFGTWGGGA